MTQLDVRVGTPLAEVETPALILDLDPFERNVAKMANYAKSVGVGLRPHAKTHRCPMIARKQIEHGAIGLCCQKVGEAEALVAAGVRDVLVSNEVLDIRKLRRLAQLAKIATISLCFDAPEQVEAASQAAQELDVVLGALVEIDMGMWRCGVAAGEAAAALAQRIAAAPGLRFLGLQAYEGKAQHLASYEERKLAIEHAAASVRLSISAIERTGLKCLVVGGGGTGTFRLEGESRLWTELQCGSYIFMDGEYAAIVGVDGKPYSEFEQSLFVLTTVMSATAPGRAVLDAGLKSYTLEKGLPGVLGRSDMRLVAASDEHGTLLLPPGTTLPLGTQLKLIPSHCDPTVNLHDVIVCVREGIVEALWPVAARGASL
ncbi:DSD1 family PLP-dependent enzyme [Paraburkholderia caribensis]|uniref:DSD1 family PLP-dependent enzyme n=1 Tax=Paraburkholderia caribensis TaxID=75105 RepID=UPI0007225B39|nr:DSD1 family PLP-dependent enzyme [Paraburkholderia caribensis]ALP68543.1 alanine racemase [Paraburkholderia caribensis]AUT57900.1 DSD1 family PLP-dependent enzyme [Paraburkholderia caribensis]